MKRKQIVKLCGIIGLSLMIAAFFVGTVPITPEMAVVSSIFVVLFALPSYYVITRLYGLRRGLGILLLVGSYGLAIETSAIHTSFPYGDFVYNDLLGSKVLGLTPWTVAFAYPPILLLAYWVARQYVAANRRLLVALGTALAAVSIDLVLDPAAVGLGFWVWETPGWYYGVPLINFAGWVLTGFMGGLLLTYVLPKISVGVGYSGLAVLWFWTWVNLFMAQFIPAIIGAVLLAMFIRLIYARHATMKS